MLDYKDIISKLNVNQKIALLTDLSCLSSEEYTRYGIPHISVGSVWQALEDTGEGITPYMLARTWNPELVEVLTKGDLDRNDREEKGDDLHAHDDAACDLKRFCGGAQKEKEREGG